MTLPLALPHAHPALPDPADIRAFQARLLHGLLLLSVALCVFFLLLNASGWFPLKPGQRSSVLVVTFIFSALVLVLQRRAKAHWVAAVTVCAITFLLFTQSLLVAQVNELRIVWFFVTLGAGYLLLGRRAGLVVALCTMVVVWGTNDLHVTPYSRQAMLVYSAVLIMMCFSYHRLIGYAMGLYRHVAQREALFRMLTEETAEVVWRVDHQLVLTYISPADERLRGYPAHDMVGRAMDAVLTDAGVPILREALRNGSALFEIPVQCHDGSERWVEMSAESERDGQGRLVGLHGRYRDVTERVRLQAELQRHRANLEDLVRERTANLSVAKDAAESASRAKNIFLSNISHELRTPLTLILGMSELARARMAEPRSRQLLDQVLAHARKLAALITDMIDYAALGAKRMELRRSPLRIAPLLRNVQTAMGEAAAAKGLDLSLVIPPEVAQASFLGDARRLQQILMQLTDNALKFTEKGQVILRVQAPPMTESDTVLLHFEVEDTGIGIAPDEHWRLFNAFEQADGTATRKHDGTGLGLALCKLLVQAMDGSISVHSQPGQGSTFHFSVLLGVPPAQLAGSDMQPPEADLRATGHSP